MDKVVQQNAAKAEESNSAAEELSSQAVHMQAVVEDLSALVRGLAKVNDQPTGNPINLLIDAARNIIPFGKNNIRGTQLDLPVENEIRPIPAAVMNDDQLEDF